MMDPPDQPGLCPFLENKKKRYGIRYVSLFRVSITHPSQHLPVLCVAKRMMRATITMKSKETIVMRPISREVQRGFLADFGGLVSVILRSSPSAASCRPVNSPEGRWRPFIGLMYRLSNKMKMSFGCSLGCNKRSLIRYVRCIVPTTSAHVVHR